MAPHVYNLRSRRSFRVSAAALRVGGDRFDVRVIQFSVQGNHIHLLVEAPHRRALARAIQGFSIRVAKGLNLGRASAGKLAGATRQRRL
jgi:REP element-mobilizing transposase RayT